MSETWDEMRQANPAQRVVALANTWRLLVDWSVYRVSLVVGSSGDSRVLLSLSNDPSLTVGVQIPMSGGPLMLDLPHHGRMLRGPIYAMAPDNDTSVAVWEALHPCKCLD